jgi:hypothetical protein
MVGGMLGLVYLQSPWPPVIAVFIWFAAQQELQAVEAREQFRRAEAMPKEPPAAVDWPPFDLRPQVTVYSWDPQTGVWIKQRPLPTE